MYVVRQSFTAKATVVYRHAITANVSQQKLQSFKVKTNVVFMYVVRQSFTAKATVVCRNAITAKVSQQKLQSFTAKATVVTQSPQKFHNRSRKVSQQKPSQAVVRQLLETVQRQLKFYTACFKT